jgi:hypothetical protein
MTLIVKGVEEPLRRWPFIGAGRKMHRYSLP